MNLNLMRFLNVHLYASAYKFYQKGYLVVLRQNKKTFLGFKYLPC